MFSHNLNNEFYSHYSYIEEEILNINCIDGQRFKNSAYIKYSDEKSIFNVFKVLHEKYKHLQCVEHVTQHITSHDSPVCRSVLMSLVPSRPPASLLLGCSAKAEFVVMDG